MASATEHGPQPGHGRSGRRLRHGAVAVALLVVAGLALTACGPTQIRGKVTTADGWFAARPSGTEDVYKIYAESFRGPEHLVEVQRAAREVVSAALGA